MRFFPTGILPSIDLKGLIAYVVREFTRVADALNNPEPTWTDYVVSLYTAKPGATKVPDFIKFQDNGAGSTGVYAFAFDKSTVEEVFFSVQLPHGIVEYSEIHPHIHWAPSDTGTGTVRWGLELTKQDVKAGAFPVTTIMYAEEAGVGTAKWHQLKGFGTHGDLRASKLSEVYLCRLFRDATHANDTYNADAFALSVDFHILMDAFGSDREFIKRTDKL